ncbi:MAG: sigma-54-dependent Fis family transcriptional regulator [Xanthomonadaceae bacterium]|nr:sigma-54-dependent Fis family transcriptional regulator [Xanthomonadaceae bacterium]
METQKLNPSLQKQALQLRLLNDLSLALQSTMSAPEWHGEIIRLIQKQFNFYSIHTWIKNKDGNFELSAQAGAYSQHLHNGFTLSRNQPSIIGKVFESKKSYLSNDISSDPHFTNLSLPIGTQSELCVPVIKNGEVVAALAVESDKTDAFDEDDLIMLNSVSHHVAAAMNNHDLWLEVKTFNQTLQKTVEEKTSELRSAHERILDQQRLLERENKVLKTLVHKEQKPAEIIGRSPALLGTISMVDKIAPTSATVLIQGESGTGKELIARRLHFQSDRSQSPYVTLNCGALQESLLESELFGHEKGAFTGAVVQKIGLAETADGGTLFLDEIGEMSPQIQTKFLRFLQEGEFYRVGGKKPIKVNVRVLSATNRDLEQEVKKGRFREDLFYRLNTITLRMPPLRERREDVPLLISSFLEKNRGANQKPKKVDPRVIETLKAYDWPGNIRELQNTVERMSILTETEIKLEDVPYAIRVPSKSKGVSSEFTPQMKLDDVERSHILRSLDFHQGNKTKTAHSLGITIKTLYNKLQRYDVAMGQNEQAE